MDCEKVGHVDLDLHFMTIKGSIYGLNMNALNE